MIIRKIENKDIGACLEIYNYYIKNTCYTFEEKALTLDEFSERVKSIAKNFPYYVAEENNQIIGYAYLNYFGTRSAYRHTADLSIYVDKDHLRKSVGSQLMLEIERESIRLNIFNIIAVVSDENLCSERFHEKMGFEQVGVLDKVGLKFGNWHSVFYFQKKV